jgi:type IV secretion system protein VirB2
MTKLNIRAGIVLALIGLCSPALAQDLSPVSTMLETIIEALTGPIGRALAIIALIVAGGLLFTGRSNWPVFIGIFVGVVLIFSAPTIIDGFGAAG